MQAETYRRAAPFGSSPPATGADTWRCPPPPLVRRTRNYVEMREHVGVFGVAGQTERVRPKYGDSIRHLHYMPRATRHTPHTAHAEGVHVCWVQVSS